MNSERKTIGNLEGYKVRLRGLRKSTDLPNCLKWMNNLQVTKFLKMSPPVSEQEEEEWFGNLAKRKDDKTFAIESLEGKYIGNIGLHHINFQWGLATTGTVIGEPEYWNNGFGTDAKMILLEYAFSQLNLRRIKSSAIAYNERSIRYSERCGYRIEGRLRQDIFKDGQFHDRVLLGLFREEWLPVWERYCQTGFVR